MSVALPIFDTNPTVEQITATDSFGNSEATVNSAANNTLYVARITNYNEWHNLLGGIDLNKPYKLLYVLYTKTNLTITRWLYNSSVGSVVNLTPWYSNVVTYNNKRYAIATPYAMDNVESYLFANGIWGSCPVYNTVADFFAGEQPIPYLENVYPITYSYTNSTVSGPSEAAIDETVTVSAVPDVGYGITDASTQILVTNNDIAVPYTWDSANNRITFTMPDPS